MGASEYEYKAIYKCRMCGAEFYTNATTNEDIARASMLNLVVGGKHNPKLGNPIFMYYVHDCENGDMGLADFQGFYKNYNTGVTIIVKEDE